MNTTDETQVEMTAEMPQPEEAFAARAGQTVELDGKSASAVEVERAKNTVAFLRGLVPRLGNEDEAARALYDLGGLLAHPLGDAEGALEAMRQAFRQRPQAVYVARGYRKAALRMQAWDDVLAALEAEARATRRPEKRAALERQRGALLLERLNNPKAARAALEAALESNPADLQSAALLERIAVAESDLAGAAKYARQMAGSVTDAALAAEWGARAARHLERASDKRGALDAAAEASARASTSPRVMRVLERLYDATNDVDALIGLRRSEISAGLVEPEDGWFEIGLLARYRLSSADAAQTAKAAFSSCAEASDGELKSLALSELSRLARRASDWQTLVDLEQKRVELAVPGPARAVLWHEIGRLYEERLSNADQALASYEKAISEDSTHRPSLERAGRAYQRSGDATKLLAMHELEARLAETAEERASAKRRIGEVLIGDPRRLVDGIAALEESLKEEPGNLFALRALERAYAKKGAHQELCALYETELEQTTDNARRAWLLLQIGSLFADHLDNRDRAIEAFARAAELGSSGPHHVLSRLEHLLEDSGRHMELAKVLAKQAELSQERGEIASLFERVAAACERGGDVEAALAAYDRALEVAPAGHPVHQAAGRAFMRSGRYNELVALLERGSTWGSHSERATWLCKAADVLVQPLGRVDDAIGFLRRALELDAAHADARRALISIFENEARYDELRTLLEQLDSIHEDRATLMRRGMLAESAGLIEQAIVCYRAAYALGLGTAARPLSRALCRAGHWKDATDLEIALAGACESPALAQRALVHRLNAAELALERLNDRDLARQQLDGGFDDSSPLSLLIAQAELTQDQPDRRVVVLAVLENGTSDPAARAMFLEQLAQSFDAIGRVDAALGVRRKAFGLGGRDPGSVVSLELAFESARDRERLIELYERGLEDTQLEPDVRSAWNCEVAALREEMGMLREAADRIEVAEKEGGVGRSLAAGVALPRLYLSLGDGSAYAAALTRLAEALPAGPERALCFRQVGQYLQKSGAYGDAALSAYEQALRAYPRDREALLELGKIFQSRGEPERLLEHLMRAFSAEDEPERVVTIGAALTVRLIQANRLPVAREVIDRVVAVAPGQLRPLILMGEIQQRMEAFKELNVTLQQLVEHPEASPRLKLEAIGRLVDLRAERLNDLEGAKRAAAHLKSLALEDDTSALEIRAKAEETVGNPAGAAETLRALADRKDVDEETRSRILLRLAQILEEKLDDANQAIDALGRVSAPEPRTEAVKRLLDLGTKTGRWDLAGRALEQALDRGGKMEREWELAIRSRLASLLEGPLARPDGAVKQYARIHELDPANVESLERLAALTMEQEPARAIEYHRALVAIDPARVDSYHALRKLMLAVSDDDGAFLAEAVLEGLGIADEEEAYFYRQRRTRLSAEATGVLTDEERALLCPERAHPALQVLSAITPLLGEVFPIDVDGYGFDPQSKTAGPLDAVVERVAKLFSVDGYRVAMVPAKIGPTVEPGRPQWILLPRGLEDAGRREQLFTAGSLVGRIAFGGTLGDLRRLSPMNAQQLEYLLWAACELAIVDYAAPARGKPIFEDIKRRLAQATKGTMSGLLAQAAARLTQNNEPLAGDKILEMMTRASARSAMLAAQDPAIAIAALEQLPAQKKAFGLPDAALAAVAFAVSRGHAELRRRLQLGVRT